MGTLIISITIGISLMVFGLIRSYQIKDINLTTVMGSIMLGFVVGAFLWTSLIIFGCELPMTMNAYDTKFEIVEQVELTSLADGVYVGVDQCCDTAIYCSKEEMTTWNTIDADLATYHFDKDTTPVLTVCKEKYKSKFVDWMFGYFNHTVDYEFTLPDSNTISYEFSME